MSGIESFGGECPNCKSPMFQKYDSCSSSLRFDACTSCGFIYGTYFVEEPMIVEGDKAIEMFAEIVEHHGCRSISELNMKYGKNPEGKDGELYPSVFDYKSDSEEEISSRVVNLDEVDKKLMASL